MYFTALAITNTKSHVNVCDIENANRIHSVACFSVFLCFCAAVT